MIRMVNAWNINDWLVGQILDGFEGEDWWKRPEGSNPAVWILGHVLLERKHLYRELGADVEGGESDTLFARGAKPEDLPSDLSPGALVEEFHSVHGRFVAHLSEMSEADLEVAVESEYPEMPKTRLGALQFLFLHETYHVGQLGTLRVMLGKEPWLQ
ncbi:MAG: DinB family protein [Planctomycetota bacterium]|jgi:uncharacterized damage-inducible protein DinB